MSLDEYAHTYHSQLLDTEAAHGYFTDKGVTLDTIEEFGIGAVIEPIMEEHEVFKTLPVFPYWNVKGGCTMIRAGVLELDRLGKWRAGVMEHDFPIGDYDVHLYNVGHSLPGLRTNEVVLTSDIWSVLLLRQQGYRVVGVPGYQNWQRPWIELFVDSKVTMVVTPHDDEPVAAQKIIDRFRKRNISCRMQVLDTVATVAERVLYDGAEVPNLLENG